MLRNLRKENELGNKQKASISQRKNIVNIKGHD